VADLSRVATSVNAEEVRVFVASDEKDVEVDSGGTATARSGDDSAFVSSRSPSFTTGMGAAVVAIAVVVAAVAAVVVVTAPVLSLVVDTSTSGAALISAFDAAEDIAAADVAPDIPPVPVFADTFPETTFSPLPTLVTPTTKPMSSPRPLRFRVQGSGFRV
jgi:hypothetical protein